MRDLERTKREGRIFERGKRGILWIAWWADQREHRESTKSIDRRVAERKLRDKLGAKDKGEAYVPGSQRVTVGQLAQILSEHHEAAGTKSRQRIGQCMRHVVAHFGAEKRTAKLIYPTLEAYVRSRRAEGAAAATIRFELYLVYGPLIINFVCISSRNGEGGFFYRMR